MKDEVHVHVHCLTNKEASTVLRSVVKHTGSGSRAENNSGLVGGQDDRPDQF